jgi:hypothetical protein
MTSWYIFKLKLEKSPTLTITLLTIIMSFVLSMLLFIAEKPYYEVH